MHAPRGNQLRLTRSACLIKLFIYYLSIYLSFNVMPFDSVGVVEDRHSIWGRGEGARLPSCDIIQLASPSEMNITGTLPPFLLMAISWSQILRDTSPRHACLGEVSRESASRQSRELIMRSERANDERTTWRQTWVPRESKFAVCLKHHLSVLIFARKVSFMVVHSHIKVGEKKKYHYKSVIQPLVLI